MPTVAAADLKSQAVCAASVGLATLLAKVRAENVLSASVTIKGAMVGVRDHLLVDGETRHLEKWIHARYVLLSACWAY
jgi:type IV secretory pathway protease TraF